MVGLGIHLMESFRRLRKDCAEVTVDCVVTITDRFDVVLSNPEELLSAFGIPGADTARGLCLRLNDPQLEVFPLSLSKGQTTLMFLLREKLRHLEASLHQS